MKIPRLTSTKRAWAIARGLLATLVAAGCGALAFRLGLPLAWILGPMLAVAVLRIAGQPVIAPVAGRKLGQFVVGTSVGLGVTGEVFSSFVAYVPLIMVTAVVGISLAALASPLFARAAGVDQGTAYYALMPGGLAEMASTGSAVGARHEPIALSHSIRVAMLVCLMPPLIAAFGFVGPYPDLSAMPLLDRLESALAFAAALAGVAGARILRLNNRWMIGALIGAGVLTASGVLSGRLHSGLLYAGQFLIGIALGARFRRDVVARLLPFAGISALFTAGLTALLLGYGALASAIVGIDPATAMLGAVPGGMAEMAMTAQVLHLSVPVVTAFHVVRSMLVNSLAPQFYRVFDALGLFIFVDRLMPQRCR